MVIIMVDFARLFLEQSGIKAKEKDPQIKKRCIYCGLALEPPTACVSVRAKSTHVHLGCVLRPPLK